MRRRPEDQRQHSSGEASRPATQRGRAWLVVPLAVFGLIALLFSYMLQGADPSKLPSALIGKAAPALALEPIEGLSDGTRPIGAFSAADLAGGQVSVVNFWASWCVPCVQEHPMLVALKERSGVQVYGVNYKDQAAAARRFLGRYGNPFTAVGADANGRAAIEWGVYGMPETFILNGRGQIVYKHVGPIGPESLEAKIMPAIKAAQGQSQSRVLPP